MSESILSVQALCKVYPAFSLKDVSFELKPGIITGFIGRNGAGKTTTLKSLMNFVHPDAGEVKFFGMNFRENEFEIKRRIGFVSGAFDYYPKQKLKAITDVTRRFYPSWDEALYRRYLEQFALDESKTPSQLSQGMKVKYAIALGLSHHAELILLDEPTSGLDPVSRDELLEIFLGLRDEGATILFSTHIITDLEKCADDILYIHQGKILTQEGLDSFRTRYRLVKPTDAQHAQGLGDALIGCSRVRDGYTALLPASQPAPEGLTAEPADLETIMVHLEKE